MTLLGCCRRKKKDSEGIAPFVRHRLYCRLLSAPHHQICDCKHPCDRECRGEARRTLLRSPCRRTFRRRCSRLCRRGFRLRRCWRHTPARRRICRGCCRLRRGGSCGIRAACFVLNLVGEGCTPLRTRPRKFKEMTCVPPDRDDQNHVRFDIPFDNNQAERDVMDRQERSIDATARRALRMMKLRQKISGTDPNYWGADVFFSIRGYISTAEKQVSYA